MSADTFNPSKHVTKITRKDRDGRGGGGSYDYLTVKWRLVWLRKAYPQATIRTEPHVIDEQGAIFRAEVTLPEGGSATGWGSRAVNSGGDFIEKAETRALGRALAALGFGTEAADEFDDDDPADDDDRERGQDHGHSQGQRKAAPVNPALSAAHNAAVQRLVASGWEPGQVEQAAMDLFGQPFGALKPPQVGQLVRAGCNDLLRIGPDGKYAEVAAQG